MYSTAIRWSALKRTIALALFCSTALVSVAQFAYTNNSGVITITKYTGSDSVVIIPSTIYGVPVTAIGDYAFDYYSALTSVTIPDTVTNIDTAAFMACTGLSQVTFGTNLITIGASAFGGCGNLRHITLDRKST